ncbi:hypothetical protein D3C74_384540 [compost metagenome]
MLDQTHRSSGIHLNNRNDAAVCQQHGIDAYVAVITRPIKLASRPFHYIKILRFLQHMKQPIVCCIGALVSEIVIDQLLH